MQSIKLLLVLTVLVGLIRVLYTQTNSWMPTDGPYGGEIFDIAVDPYNDDVIYCVLEDGLYYTEDTGQTWSKINTPEMDVWKIIIIPSNPIIILIGGQKGIYKSIDNGQTWTFIAKIVTVSAAYDPLNPNRVFIGSTEGRIYKSIDFGDSWREIKTGSKYNIQTIAISPADSNIAFAGIIGNMDFMGDGVYKSIDGGNSWFNTLCPASDITSIALDPDNPQEVFVGSLYAGVCKSIDCGGSWMFANQGLPDTNTIEFLLFTKVKTRHLVTAVMNFGLFEIETDHLHWTMVETGVDVHRVNYLSNFSVRDDRYLVGTNTGLLLGNFIGEKFSLIGVKSIDIRSICVNPNNVNQVFSIGRGIFKSEDKGNTWDLIDEGIGFQWGNAIAIDPVQPNILYAGIYAPDGAIYKSINGGLDWIKTSLTDVAINDIEIAPSMTSTIFTGGLEDPYIGGIFKSTDSGITWDSLGENLSHKIIISLAIHPENESVVLAGTDKSGIFKTEDGGKSWFQINDGLFPNVQKFNYVNDIQFDPHNPDTIYACIEKLGVFRTFNSGLNWEAVNKNLDSSYIRSIAINPENTNELYVGTLENGVFQTENRGDSWNTLNDGWDKAGIFCLSFAGNVEKVLLAARATGVWKYNLSPTKIDQRIIHFLPAKLGLSQNCPNPFNFSTIFEIFIPQEEDVRLSIFNNLSEIIVILVNGRLNQGNHRISWEAKGFASGVYFYRLEAGHEVLTRKMLLIK